MIDRVADALCARIWREDEYTAQRTQFHDNYCNAAVEALKAMRNPTEAMISAFNDTSHESAEAKWNAMIDKALELPT